jgi:hypothetical protein
MPPHASLASSSYLADDHHGKPSSEYFAHFLEERSILSVQISSMDE